MDFMNVPLSRSIGFELLKKIFGVYCIAAVLISMTQAWVEYTQSRDRIIQNMQKQQFLVEKGLATAVWHLDKPLLNSLMKGILSHSNITGIQVYDEFGQIMAHVGDDQVLSSDDLTARYAGEPYQHSFELFDPVKISEEAVGKVIFYTDKEVIITDVKPTLISLLMAAIIKTLFLWIVFIYFGRTLLSRPLNEVVEAIRSVPVDDSKGSASNYTDNSQLNEIDLIKYAVANLEKRLVSTLSELQQSNTKLNNINVHLQRAVEQSPTISIILSQDGKVVYVTPSFSELTGHPVDYTQELLNGVLGEHSFKELVGSFNQEGSDSFLWQGEVKVRGKEEDLLFLNANLSPVYCENGLIESYLISASNITNLKRLELNLKKKNTQQLEIISQLEEAQAQLVQAEKMASVGQLAAGVAHEINNPIGFINSNLTTLVDYLNGLFGLIEQYRLEACRLNISLAEVDDYRRKIDFDFIKDDVPMMLDETQEGLERVKKIIRDLMDFSRVNNAEFIQYDLRKGLESTLNVAWHELKYKAKIVREFDEIPEVECIPSEINQVFMNLLVNAAQAITEGGVISLRIRRIDERVVIDIEDNGSGIDSAHLDKLFDPFFTTKPVGQGTGLGLSVSYGIIKKHRGTIDVASQAGNGTCFSISLPIRQD